MANLRELARKAKRKIGRVAGNVGGTILSTPHILRGALADTKRARLLHRQGYGGYRDSVLSILRKGKKGGKRY